MNGCVLLSDNTFFSALFSISFVKIIMFMPAQHYSAIVIARYEATSHATSPITSLRGTKQSLNFAIEYTRFAKCEAFTYRAEVASRLAITCVLKINKLIYSDL
jgi:hypothetical protein